VRSVKKRIFRNLSNIPGWRTKERIVVFESDDWGSIRMPSNRVFSNLVEEGINIFKDGGFRFNKYDSLATHEDLALLFDVLSSVKDSKGNAAVMTPISIVANPDFDKIKESDFSEYYYEPFTETLKKYPGCENSFTMWKDGINQRLFVPQFHGREHLNIKVWMKALAAGNKMALIAFKNNMWGISTANDPEIKVEFQSAFDFIDPSDIEFHKEVIASGLKIFKNLFGYQATYFVPPNGHLSSKLEEKCFFEGIKYLSTSRICHESLGYGKSKRKIHWIGQKNREGLMYITRNCFFEPGESGKDWVDSCLNDISIAFSWQKPAIIGSHRVNFTGSLDVSNRDNGLHQLTRLLKSIVRKWPDVIFLTSSELGDCIN
jgi:hypothetical protein